MSFESIQKFVNHRFGEGGGAACPLWALWVPLSALWVCHCQVSVSVGDLSACAACRRAAIHYRISPGTGRLVEIIRPIFFTFAQLDQLANYFIITRPAVGLLFQPRRLSVTKYYWPNGAM